jgi:dimethylamine/trimethylamine dehydrogenase
VLAFGAERVVVATGADWVPALWDPRLEAPADEIAGSDVFTPHDVFAGRVAEGPVWVFDYDNYYMGGAVAERLARSGLPVRYVTPADYASAWTMLTNELPDVHRVLTRAGVEIVTRRHVSTFSAGLLTTRDIFTGAPEDHPCAALVIVGHRRPRRDLFDALTARRGEWAEWGVKSVDRIGDSLAPGALVHAIHSGHLYARGLDAPASETPYRFDNGLLEPA